MFGNRVYSVKERGNILMDDRGILYMNQGPVLTAELDFLGHPFVSETPDFRQYLELLKEVESHPLINAWLDAGVVREGTILLELPDMDVDGTITRELREVEKRTRIIKFYHLGEDQITAEMDAV